MRVSRVVAPREGTQASFASSTLALAHRKFYAFSCSKKEPTISIFRKKNSWGIDPYC